MIKTKTPPVRIAFIGAGGITQAHKPAFLEYPERLKCAAVVDPFRASAEKLAGELGKDVPVFADYEEMLKAVGKEVDGVLITTPHWLHAPAAATALKMKIPVLVEKPAVCSLDELRKLMVLEKKHRSFVMAGQMQRFDKTSHWLRNWVQDSKRCGKLNTFEINIWQNIFGYIHNKPDAWIVDGKRAGGGICISVGIHPLDLLRFVTGADFVEVSASGRFDAPFKNGAESQCLGWLRMSNGTVGTLNASYTVAKCPYSQSLALFGEKGTVWQQVASPGNGQYAGDYYSSSLESRKITSWGAMYSGFEKIHDQKSFQKMPEGGNSFTLQLLEFGAAIAEKRKPVENTLKINLNSIATVNALVKSIRTGKPCKVAVK